MDSRGDNEYISTVIAGAKIIQDIHSWRNLDMNALFGEVRAEF